MKKITLVTGNKRKIAEAQAACESFEIEIDPKSLEIDEIQHHDPIEISKHKAAQAFELTGRPIVINDDRKALSCQL